MKKPKKKLTSEINVVPLIDVMLVLLIVFMVTAPLLMQGVKVELPEANSVPLEDQEQDPLIVSVKADGSYWFELGNDGQKKEELAVIKDRVSKILRQQPKTPVLVWGDTKVEYGVVVHLMSELQGAGAPSVGLVTEPPKNR
ncbi:protein TolR [Porticoccaceae bacterium LTM1]|nr:protein TolR [Porticoccaceae bacterium LTM1]